MKKIGSFPFGSWCFSD